MQNENSSSADSLLTENANRFIPLSTNVSAASCLFIDTHAAPAALQEYAHIRIQAATDLLESMTCMSISNTCDQDLRRVANAAYLLNRDGLELMGSVRSTCSVREFHTGCSVQRDSPSRK